MALTALSLQSLKETIDRIDDEIPDLRRILALGYPDIVASPKAIRALFQLPATVPLGIRADSEGIVRWHNAARVTDSIIESQDLFSALDFELEIVDNASSRGGEIPLDLNEPVPEHYHERYALVIDHGTCEHCFNIAQAIKNVATMVAKGGYVIHSNPLNMFNHGFYNLNPTWYHDFYKANGFELLKLIVVSNGTVDPLIHEVPAVAKFRDIPERSSNLVLARRLEVRPIVWPQQTKYTLYPELRG